MGDKPHAVCGFSKCTQTASLSTMESVQHFQPSPHEYYTLNCISLYQSCSSLPLSLWHSKQGYQMSFFWLFWKKKIHYHLNLAKNLPSLSFLNCGQVKRLTFCASNLYNVSGFFPGNQALRCFCLDKKWLAAPFQYVSY